MLIYSELVSAHEESRLCGFLPGMLAAPHDIHALVALSRIGMIVDGVHICDSLKHVDKI